MTQSKTLILKNTENELSRLVEFIDGFAEEWHLNPEIIMNINLVLEEAFINVISYAYPDRLQHEITFRINREQNTLLMEVEDDGIPFNPLEQNEPDRNLPVEDRPVGGLGIFLIKKLMTETNYKRIGGKNILLLKKELRS